MDINDILVLCRAGFTSEQIGKMSAAPKTPPVKPTPKADTPEPDDKEKDTDDKEKDTGDDPAPASDNADIIKAIADLKNAIVNSNINNSDQPAPKVDTVDSIINSMIGGSK